MRHNPRLSAEAGGWPCLQEELSESAVKLEVGGAQILVRESTPTSLFLMPSGLRPAYCVSATGSLRSRVAVDCLRFCFPTLRSLVLYVQ